MGTKDRTLRRMPSAESERAALQIAGWIIGSPAKDGLLAHAMLRLVQIVKADALEPGTRGPKLKRDVLLRLAAFLDTHDRQINTDPASKTVAFVVETFDPDRPPGAPVPAGEKPRRLETNRVVELMHQLRDLVGKGPIVEPQIPMAAGVDVSELQREVERLTGELRGCDYRLAQAQAALANVPPNPGFTRPEIQSLWAASADSLPTPELIRARRKLERLL